MDGFVKRVTLAPSRTWLGLWVCICVHLSLSLSSTCISTASDCKEDTSVPGPKTHRIAR